MLEVRLMEPLENCPREILAAVRGVLTDIDDTVSTDGTLTAEAYGALRGAEETRACWSCR